MWARGKSPSVWGTLKTEREGARGETGRSEVLFVVEIRGLTSKMVVAICGVHN